MSVLEPTAKLNTKNLRLQKKIKKNGYTQMVKYSKNLLAVADELITCLTILSGWRLQG